jgi:hypothetical protein
MIKPEDLPPELQDKCFLHARGEGPSQQWSIAEILNAAIEAGVVSPPCYCGRKAFGGVAVGPIIEHEGIPILWAPGANPQNVVTEHWKGQSE